MSLEAQTRNQTALGSAVESLLSAGAPDAVGISVDMSDADSIAAGFAAVSQRWGELNSLVHTIGPGDGYFEDMDDAQWEAAFTLGTMSGVRSIRTGDVTRHLRGQEHCGACHLVDMSGAAHGHGVAESLLSAWWCDLHHALGEGDVGRQCVHPDAVGGQFEGRSLGVVDHPGLGR
ncbi:MAG: 3-oxoacyl-[acyl-carrier protein] reductase, partial [Mycobacterium sp.]|nr:3-oxoacyl-[acyl-carrier protein] reductase [Mycobacterium sp.]